MFGLAEYVADEVLYSPQLITECKCFDLVHKRAHIPLQIPLEPLIIVPQLITIIDEPQILGSPRQLLHNLRQQHPLPRQTRHHKVKFIIVQSPLKLLQPTHNPYDARGGFSHR